MEPIHNIENKYLETTTINILLNQLIFFGMCDITLCNYVEKKVTVLVGLNSLLLYYVITYFVQRITEIVIKMKSNSSSQRTTSSLMLCIFKIILEWSKAIVVIICLKEQGLRPHPHLFYSIVTCLYYLATELIYRQLFLVLFKCFHFEYFEGLEELYIPVFLQSLSICFPLLLLPIVCFHCKHFALVCFYHTIFLQTKYFYKTYWKQLVEERSLMASFAVASRQDLQAWNDICAICLSNMTRARCTSCGHLFHSKCLRRSLQSSLNCPLCKTNIITNLAEFTDLTL